MVKIYLDTGWYGYKSGIKIYYVELDDDYISYMRHDENSIESTTTKKHRTLLTETNEEILTDDVNLLKIQLTDIRLYNIIQILLETSEAYNETIEEEKDES